MALIPILNIGQFDKEESLIDFYSSDLSAHLRKNEEIVHTPHRHDFFLCVIFRKGTGTHEVDFASYAVQPGSIFFLKPGQTHFWKFNSAPEGYIFFHTQDFFEFELSNAKISQFPFYYSYENPPKLQLKAEDLESVILLFKAIDNEYHKKAAFKKQKLVSLINLAYIDLTRFYTTSESHKIVESTTYLATLKSLEGLIQKFFRTQKSATFYAKKLNITTKHLNRITKNTINKTSSELISERIILEAKRLLVHSENSLAHTAELLGYEDYAYFSRVFKSKTKYTPSDFRSDYKTKKAF